MASEMTKPDVAGKKVLSLFEKAFRLLARMQPGCAAQPL